jgi:HK97 gp10 family phage protein
VASSLRIELKGVSGLLNKAKLLVPRIRQGVQQTVAETALSIESDAKQFAPVDTGRLRSSIHAEVAPNGLSAVVATNVSYAPIQEFGSRFQRAQPFLFPAYEKNRAGFVANLKANLKLF